MSYHRTNQCLTFIEMRYHLNSIHKPPGAFANLVCHSQWDKTKPQQLRYKYFDGKYAIHNNSTRNHFIDSRKPFGLFLRHSYMYTLHTYAYTIHSIWVGLAAQVYHKIQFPINSICEYVSHITKKNWIWSVIRVTHTHWHSFTANAKEQARKRHNDR